MADPSLDDLIEAHRTEVHLGDRQRTRGRARLLARAGAGVAISTLATGVAARSASHGALVLCGKVALGLALVGGLGSAYYYSKRTVPPAATSKPLSAAAALPVVVAKSEPESTPPPTPTPEPQSPGPTVVPSAPRSRAAPKASAATTKRPSLADEVRAMQAVDGALRSGNAAHALELLDQAPVDTGGMAEERAAAGVFALCNLNHVDEAQRAAIAFARQWPKSPLAPRVASSCAE